MTMAAETTAISQSVLDAAAAWLARRDKGFSAVEQSQFETWRAADPEHAAALTRLERSWGAMDRPLQVGVADEVLRGLAARARGRKRRRAGLACTAVLALLVAGSLWNGSRHAATSTSKSGVAVLVPARQVLPDGTMVELKDSASVAFEFTGAQRRVILSKGVAHFQVTKDPSRPFVVAASGIEIRAVGTAFTVDHRAQRVEVLVTEGRVAVVPAEPSPSIPANPAAAKADVMVSVGEVVTLAVESRKVIVPVTTVAASELAERLEWRIPRLEFTGTPLAEAVKLMNQHNRIRLVIADPLLGQEQVSGLFRADRADGFVQALETGFGIAAEHRGENEIVLRRVR